MPLDVRILAAFGKSESGKSGHRSQINFKVRNIRKHDLDFDRHDLWRLAAAADFYRLLNCSTQTAIIYGTVSTV